MFEFWSIALESTLARNAILAAALASVACGVMGTYVVTRRITYIAAGIAHCVLAGMGGARYVNEVHGWTFLEPIHGAFLAAVLAAAIIGWTTLQNAEREDTAIGAVWSVGMAIGILFIYKTPGYHEDLMSYLFGNILLVTTTEVWMAFALVLVILATVLACFEEFRAVCFDEEFARVRNIRVGFYYILLLMLTAVSVVLLSLLVGIVLVIALLTLPAAIAGRFAASMGGMMLLSGLFCAFFTAAGLTLSYAPDLPTGPVIIVIAGVVYLGVLAMRRFLRSFQ